MKPLADIIRDASALSGLDSLERTRKPAVVHLRAAIALAAEKTGYRHDEIGKALRLDRTTVIHLLSMSGRPAVRSLLHKLDPPLAIELDTTFDGDAVSMITLGYVHRHYKEALCSSPRTSSPASGTTAQHGITPAAPVGRKTSPKPGGFIRLPKRKKNNTVTVATGSSGGRRGMRGRNNKRFMNGEELRSYAMNDLGMTEKEFGEARAATRVYPTYPRRHQTGAG